MRRGHTKGDVLEHTVDAEHPRFNVALARAIAVLRAFDVDDQFLGNTEIAARIAVPKPTVSRLTHTLTELGYLSYREEIGKYELAPGILGLAYPYLANMPEPASFMNELAKSTQANVGLAILDGLSAVYLEYALGEPNMNRRQRREHRRPSLSEACAEGTKCAVGSGEGGSMTDPFNSSALKATVRSDSHG